MTSVITHGDTDGRECCGHACERYNTEHVEVWQKHPILTQPAIARL